MGRAGLEEDAVPVVADSRSEELTDGQETPFLPPFLAPSISRLGCPTKALRAASKSRSATSDVCVSKEQPLGDVRGIKNSR